ncbi:M56 family metallopeptidase [Paenibacillus sp. PDC88]|uniref:M56 family metallopeptidase n=1 Tax=Paenibacillus sp. PDC88 TaxID=1884375 RepID=UPI0008947A83|nr:M56 family metallopeptidase [Paenibacillus sp. PDC88]SDW35193.1 Signal transducer regulating beta-lactamase production, contains metallopeptidase domain [Paenibacillus sp. PDC88]
MNLMQMSLSAGILIVITVALRTLALHRLPKSAILLLWLGALYILLNPLPIASPLSVQHLLQATSSETDSVPGGQNGITKIVTIMAGTTAAEDAVQWTSLFMVIWLAVALLLAVYFALGYFRSRHIAASALPIAVTSSLAEVLSEQRLPLRPIRILTSDRVGSPTTCGIFRPCILFPKGYNYDDQEQLRFVIAHELVHIKRLDALWKLLMLVAVCVHWFNPLVWLMYGLMKRDLELACDERVLCKFGPEQRSAYALSLLRAAERGGRMAATHSGFSADSVEERIVSIMNFKKLTVFTTVLSLVAVIGVTTAFATEASKPSGDLSQTFDKADETDVLSSTGDDEALEEKGSKGKLDEKVDSVQYELTVNVDGKPQKLTVEEYTQQGGSIIIKDANGQSHKFTHTLEIKN